MKGNFALYFFLIFVRPFFAQQPSHFFLGKDEFESVQIYDVIQDKDLNYWFATDQGFYKYDGYNFLSIECKGLKGQSAFGFVKNKSGIIFCYNLNNQILKIENGQCSVFYELKEKEQSADMSLSISNDNSLIVFTKTVLLFDETGKQQLIQKVPHGYYGQPFQTNGGKTICHILGKDSLLVIEGKKASMVPLKNRADKIKGVFKIFEILSKIYAVNLIDKRVYSIDESDFSMELLSNQPIRPDKEFLRFYNENDQLWIAGLASGVRLMKDPGSEESLKLLFPQYLISDVFKDHEGNILLSTFNNGVIVIPNLQIPDVLPISNEQAIVSIHYDEELGLLMGTIKGQLLSFNGTDYQSISNAGTRPLQAVFSWPNFPYILFDDGLVKAYHKKTGKVASVHYGSLKDAAMFNDTTIYLALNTGTCKLKLTGQDKFEKGFLNEIRIRSYAVGVEQKDQFVFVATSDGLKIISPAGKIKTAVYNNETIFANDIAAENDKIFVATKNNGILIFDKGEVVSKISPVVNQKDAEVYKIKVVKDRVYINSSQGFVVMNTTGKTIVRLNKAYGFSINKVFDFDLVNEQLWITHSKGVQKLNIAQLSNTTPKPLIRISAVKVNDSLVEKSLPGQFRSDERKVLFTISSPTLRNKENIQYHYKLQDYDSEWQLASYNDYSIIYNALEPGSYTFMVKAENQGVFSETVSYSFVISKPFYFRWWFFLFAGAVFILTTFMIYRYQLKKQRKRAEMINEINISKLTAIQSQMNPHFIFNSLNSIQDLVLKGDIDNSYTFITKFSDLIRRTLNYSDKDFIDFEQEIKLIELYLSLEKLRFKAQLDYVIESNGIEDIMIPPMLIQPFIENSLIHGLLHKEEKKEISIRFQLEDVLICTIEDNGIGREKSKEIKTRQRSEHESFSGQAIKKRFTILNHHFKEKLGFEYEDLYHDNQPSGTKVTISIPVKRKF